MSSCTSCNLGLQLLLSPHVRESRFPQFLLVESRIGHLHDGVVLLLRPEHLLVESGILGYGIRNTVKGMLNATDDWNPESTGQLTNYWNPVPGMRYVEFGIHSVESRLQDCLGFPLNTWGETCICNCIQTCTPALVLLQLTKRATKTTFTDREVLN